MRRKLLYSALVALGLLHQDFWLRDDPSIVLGFLPVGLAYHAALTLTIAGTWLLVVRYAWPEDLIAFGRAEDEDSDAE